MNKKGWKINHDDISTMENLRSWAKDDIVPLELRELCRDSADTIQGMHDEITRLRHDHD